MLANLPRMLSLAISEMYIIEVYVEVEQKNYLSVKYLFTPFLNVRPEFYSFEKV